MKRQRDLKNTSGTGREGSLSVKYGLLFEILEDLRTVRRRRVAKGAEIELKF